MNMPPTPKMAYPKKIEFGQVWEWGGTKIMLIAPLTWTIGRWTAISLSSFQRVDTWAGLYDDPSKRLVDWKFLSLENE